jgi:hypothetical protein
MSSPLSYRLSELLVFPFSYSEMAFKTLIWFGTPCGTHGTGVLGSCRTHGAPMALNVLSNFKNHTLSGQQPVTLNKRRCNMVRLALSVNNIGQCIAHAAV